jgi:predicted ribosome quality control (RQC) complex YloA/Tae2 family protein
MEAITIREIVRELRGECVPGRVQAVFQSSLLDIVVTIRNRSTRHLVLSVRPALPSAHLASRKPRALPAPTAFCSLLRKHLVGMVLTDILDPGLERAVHLLFAASGASPPAFRLTVEIMGRWSNIVLMEGDSLRILDARRRVPPHPGRERAIVQGETYRLPPSGGRAYLETIGEEQFRQLQEQSEKEGLPLHAKLVGLGPGLLALAEARPGESLLESIRAVIREIDEGKARPVYYPGSGRLLPLPLPEEAAGEAMEFQSMSAAADHAFRNTADGEERAGLVARSRRELKRRLKKLRKKEERLAGEMGAGGEERLLQAAGRGLLASLGDIPRGAASFELHDPENPGSPPRTVELDPSVGPRRNAEAFFRKAKKARLRAESARRRLPALRKELAAVQERIGSLETLPLHELREQRRPPPAGRGTGAAAGAGKKKPLPDIREYRGDRWRILVGKNSRGNDYLTSRVATPEDLWLHARDYPGAHTVLKPVGPSSDPPPEVVRAAAEVAAWHSAAREESLVDVSCALRKHVRKVKGRPAGQVLVPKSKTVRVRPRVPEGFREIRGPVVK